MSCSEQEMVATRPRQDSSGMKGEHDEIGGGGEGRVLIVIHGGGEAG